MKKLNAYKVYLFEEFAASLFFTMMFTVNLVYQVQVAHLNPLQLVLVGTVLEATAFVFEIPTGVVADVYSRRLSVIFSFFLIGASFILQTAPVFEIILVGSVVGGIGWTFMSGALEAWVAGEMGEKNAGAAYLRAAQIGSIGAFFGIIAGVALGSITLALPMLLAGTLTVTLGIFLTITMPENGFAPTPRENRNSFQHMLYTFRNGVRLVRLRPVLITILIIGAIYGAFSEGYDRLWTAHLLENFTLPTLGSLQPIVWFGIINGAGLLLNAAATEIVRRRVDTNSHSRVASALLTINSLLIVGILAFALAGNFALALVTLLAVKPLRGMNAPLATAWANQSLEPSVRATVFSMQSQADALGQIIGGPILGALATAFTLRAGLVGAGLILLPALFLLAVFSFGARRSAHAPRSYSRLSS